MKSGLSVPSWTTDPVLQLKPCGVAVGGGALLCPRFVRVAEAAGLMVALRARSHA